MMEFLSKLFTPRHFYPRDVLDVREKADLAIAYRRVSDGCMLLASGMRTIAAINDDRDAAFVARTMFDLSLKNQSIADAYHAEVEENAHS